MIWLRWKSSHTWLLFPKLLANKVAKSQNKQNGKQSGSHVTLPLRLIAQDQKAEESSSSGGRFKLRDFPEGYVGKLQVLKSGRTRLLLGSVALTLEMGTLLSFHQDLACLRLPEETGSGDMTILGQVPHKLICLPDMEELLSAYSKLLWGALGLPQISGGWVIVCSGLRPLHVYRNKLLLPK